MNSGWKRDQYGSGATLNLGYGFQLSVDWNRGMSRDNPNKYGFNVLGNASKKVDFETVELAQEAAERAAKKILADVIQKLG